MSELLYLHELIINVALSGTRMAVAFYTVPFLHRSTLVPMARNAIILSLTIPVLPLIISYQLPRQETMVFVLALLAKEALIGFIFGFLIAIVFWAAQCAGTVIDHQRGSFFAIMADPLAKNQTTPLGSFLLHLAVILFFITGGFRDMVGAIIDSYRIWPVNAYYPHINQNLVEFIARQIIRCLNLAVILAAPVAVSALTADQALGLVNRFAPQVNIFMISLAVKSAISTLIMVLYIWFMVKYLRGTFMDSDAILQTIRMATQ